METDQTRKINRLNRSLVKVIQTILLKSPRLAALQVRDVLVDRSWKVARVWLSGPTNQLELIDNDRISIQNQLPRYLKLRQTPKLLFLPDDRYLDHMEELFQTLGDQHRRRPR